MSEQPNQVNNHVADQLDAYALGILEQEEVALVEAHLADCQECQRLHHQARAVVGFLALAPRQVAPPARLKQSILARIAQEERSGQGQVRAQALDPAAAPSDLTPERQRLLAALQPFLPGRQATPAPAAAMPETGPRDDQQLQGILRLLRAPRPAAWELPGTPEAPQARARLIGSPEEQTAVLIVSGLEPLPPERDYQLWFLREGQPVGSAVFDVQRSGERQILVHAPRQLGYYDLAAITPEPAGGSPGPTGPIMIAGEIKAA